MIKEVSDNDIAQAIDFLIRVFSEFNSEQGRNSFESNLREKFLPALKSGERKMWAYYIDDKIVGVIARRDNPHISLMFVDRQHHRQGIARQLFDVVTDEFKKENAVQITVNSSPYAIKFYEHLGFVKTGEPQEKGGIISIPMMKIL